MTKKQNAVAGTTRIPTDYTLIQVHLTLAVESYLCDEHAEESKLRESDAVEAVLERLHRPEGAEIIVLRTDTTPLTLTKGTDQ